MVRCPNCGSLNTTKHKDTAYPYQDEPYETTYIHCHDCGYIK